MRSPWRRVHGVAVRTPRWCPAGSFEAQRTCGRLVACLREDGKLLVTELDLPAYIGQQRTQLYPVLGADGGLPYFAYLCFPRCVRSGRPACAASGGLRRTACVRSASPSAPPCCGFNACDCASCKRARRSHEVRPALARDTRAVGSGLRCRQGMGVCAHVVHSVARGAVDCVRLRQPVACALQRIQTLRCNHLSTGLRGDVRRGQHAGV